jgi:ribosomal protein S18 acetylase RimI-like enzyme
MKACPVNIAPATISSAPGIARVHVGSWRAAYADILDAGFLTNLSVEARALQWHDILQKGESQTLVAQQDGSVVGFISFGRCRDEGAPRDRGEVWALYAEPGVWGQGVGRALLERAVQALRSSGHGSTSLWVLSQNRRGIAFYEAFGFQRVEGSEKLFELGGRQVEEVCMMLQHDAQPAGTN